MKKGILFLFLAATFSSKGQSLKDLLYSGKLKMDSNTVIRKTDDLSTKIDTSTKKAPEVKAAVATTKLDTAINVNNTKSKAKLDTAFVVDNTKSNNVKEIAAPAGNVVLDTALSVKDVGTAAVAGNEVTANNEVVPPANSAPAPKTNNKIWKEYTDSIAVGVKNEVMSSKKIKKDTYFFLVEYELAPDGGVTITNVTVSPENKELQAQVSQRMEAAGAPHMNPVPNSTPTTKKAKRRYSFSITKD